MICCEKLDQFLTRECPEHPNRLDCPDVVLHRFKNGEIGMVIHDGGGSIYGISYCPFCGSEIS